MKVLITGATGSIGGIILQHLLKRDEITEVIALTRRPLPKDTSHLKLTNIIIEDFGNLNIITEESWNSIQDADALIWAMGTYTFDENANFKYPLAFQEAFLQRKLLRLHNDSKKLRFLLLGGALVETDQNRWLYFLGEQRRIKGLLQTKSLELAERNPQIWEAIIIRPGGIMFGGDRWLNRFAEYVFGRNWVIRAEELGAAVSDIIVRDMETAIVLNSDLVDAGRSALQLGK